MPYRQDLIIRLTEELAPAIAALHEALKSVVAQLPNMTNCELHNNVAREELLKRVTTQGSIMTAYPQVLVEKLEQSKDSELGHVVRTLRENLDKVRTLLYALAKVDWTDNMLEKGDGCFAEIEANIRKNHEAWVSQSSENKSFVDFIADLDVGVYVSELKKIFESVGIPAPELQDIPLVVYGECQINEDIAELSAINHDIFDVISIKIYTALVERYSNNPVLAGVFSSLMEFYREMGAHPFPQSGAPAYSGTQYLELYASIWPTLSIDMLKKLEFILKNEECCESLISKLTSIIGVYVNAKNHLHQMSKYVIGSRSENVLGKSEKINNMCERLIAFTSTIQSTHEVTKNLLEQLEGTVNNVCISEYGVDLLSTLRALGVQMQDVEKHTEAIEELHCEINDLFLNEASTEDFLSFDKGISNLNLYYDEGIADAWGALNESLTQHSRTFRAIMVVLRGSETCFINRGTLVEKFEELNDLDAYLQSSEKALAVYKEKILARSTMHLYRIYQQLQPLAMISNILLRNSTIKVANLCLVEVRSYINSIGGVLVGLHSHKVYSLEYFDDLLKIEGFIKDATTALGTYVTAVNGLELSGMDAKSIISASFEDELVFKTEEFADYIGKIVKFLSESGEPSDPGDPGEPSEPIGMSSSLSSLIATLESEDGSNGNERCYTEEFGELKEALSGIKTFFDGLAATFSTTFNGSFALPDTVISQFSDATLPYTEEALLSLFNSLSANLAGLGNLLGEADALAKNPTCCYKRPRQQFEIFVILEGIHGAILSATSKLKADPLTNESEFAPLIGFVTNATSATNTLISSLEDIPADSTLACKASLIAAQTEGVILPAFHAVAGRIIDILAKIGNSEYQQNTSEPEYPNICQALFEMESMLDNVVWNITQALSEFKIQLSQVDLFVYSQEFVDELKQFWSALRNARKRLQQFTQSFKQDNCETCNLLNYAPLFERVIKSFSEFEYIIHLIESNSCKRYSQTLHELVNVVDSFGQSTLALWGGNFDDLDPAKIRILDDVVIDIADAIISLGNVAASSSSGSATHVELTGLINAAKERIWAALVDFGIIVPVQSHALPEYGQLQIATDWARLMATVQHLTSSMSGMPPMRDHFVIRPSWERLSSAMLQLAANVGTRDSNEALDLSNEIFKLCEAHKAFISRVNQLEYCKPVDSVVRNFANVVTYLTRAFDASQSAFVNNLSAEDSATFATRINDVTGQISSLHATITQRPANDASPYICSIDVTFAGELLDALNLVKGATVDMLKVFNPSLQIEEPNDYLDADKVVIIRGLVNRLKMLQESMSAAWTVAATCQVRDYRQSTVDAAKSLCSAVSSLIPAIPSLFDLINICMFCEKTDIASMLEEVPPVLEQMYSDLLGVVAYLEGTCCSRLAFQTYSVAQKADVISKYLEVLEGYSSEQLVDFISNGAVQTFSAKLEADLTKLLPNKDLKLIQWSKIGELLENLENNNCLARDIESFLNEWDTVLTGIIDGLFKANLGESVASGIAIPDICECSKLPDGVRSCINTVAKMAASLGRINQSLSDVKFFYSKVFPFLKLLITLSEAVDELTIIGQHTQGAFCSRCSNFDDAFASILDDNVEGKEQSALVMLKSEIGMLMGLLAKYCDAEIAEELNLFKYRIGELNKVFEYLTGSGLATFFGQNLIEEFTYSVFEQISNAYNKSADGVTLENLGSLENSGLNELLTFISKVASSNVTFCQMANVLPYLKAFNETFKSVLERAFSVVGLKYDDTEDKTDGTGYESLEFSSGPDALLQQFKGIAEVLAISYTHAEAIRTKVDTDRFIAEEKGAALIFQVGSILKLQGEGFRKIYNAWKTSQCLKWGDCSICDDC
ncbi:MAG: hypothetical protein LBQ43_04110, partial [Holosporales bacterium]|nr:hypothetical protein [Holosporales bacterium]